MNLEAWLDARRWRGADVGDPSLLPGQITRLLEELTKAPDTCLAPACEVGDRIGRFLLVREIGRGGFGVVFEAEDTHLRRRVAIKVLRPERGSSPSTLEWIQREGEAAARVHHPTVVTLHDVGQWDGGTYLVYELLEGETLTERLERGPLSRGRGAAGAAVRRGRALPHARGGRRPPGPEARQRLHRDRREREDPRPGTRPGGGGGGDRGRFPALRRAGAVARGGDGCPGRHLRMGHPGPEAGQGNGLRGCFRAAAASPRSFRALGERARSQDPAPRPADGSALVAELDGIDRRRRRAGLFTAAAAAMAVVAAFYGLGRSLKPSPGPPSGPFRVAVADAENGSGRPALDGIGDLVARGLQGSPRLQVLDRARLVGVLRASGRTAPDRIDRGLARFATRQAGGAALLVPSVAETGEVLSIAIEALEPESGKVLFAVREQAVSEQDVLPAVERLVGRVRVSLRDREPEVRAADQEVSRAVSSSLQAHQHYLAGVRCVDRPSDGGGTSFAHCERHFRQALAIDPEFPLAHFELARMAYWQAHPPEELRVFLAPAVRNVDWLPPREQALIRAWDAGISSPRKAIEILQAAGKEFPEDPRVAHALGEALRKQGRHAEAVPHLERAVSLDPGFELAADMLVASLGTLDRVDELRRIAGPLAATPPSPGILVAEASARPSRATWRGRSRSRGAPPLVGRGWRATPWRRSWSPPGSGRRRRPCCVRTRAREPGRAPSRLARFLLLRGRIREARAIIDRNPVPPTPGPDTSSSRRRFTSSSSHAWTRPASAESPTRPRPGRRTSRRTTPTRSPTSARLEQAKALARLLWRSRARPPSLEPSWPGGRTARPLRFRPSGGSRGVTRHPRSRTRPRLPPGTPRSAPWRRHPTRRPSPICAVPALPPAARPVPDLGLSAKPAPRGPPAGGAGISGGGARGAGPARGPAVEGGCGLPLAAGGPRAAAQARSVRKTCRRRRPIPGAEPRRKVTNARTKKKATGRRYGRTPGRGGPVRESDHPRGWDPRSR